VNRGLSPIDRPGMSAPSINRLSMRPGRSHSFGEKPWHQDDFPGVSPPPGHAVQEARSTRPRLSGLVAGNRRRDPRPGPVGTRREPDRDATTTQARCRVCIDEPKGRVPVVAGAVPFDPGRIELSQHAAIPAPPVLVVTPYYHKPTQEGSISTSGDHRCDLASLS